MDLSGRCVGSSYVLQRPIGQGATGTVWEALDRTSGESVAVKLLHESLLRQPKLVTRFVQERTILRMLRHRNVVRVRDLFSVGETLGLVMDLVAGGNLRDLLRDEHTIAPGEAARLTAQVAAALAEAHELGVVHRDLKPDNILLDTGDGPPETRLTDFGVARILNTPSMTTPSSVFGTPHYMAPEAFRGSTASPATDVYAFGVLLYELVSGYPPYRSDSIPDLMRLHLEGAPERRPGIPDELWEVITACMEQKPRLRPTAAELVAELSDLAIKLSEAPALTPPPEPAPAPARQRDSALGREPAGMREPAERQEPAPHPRSIVPKPRREQRRNAAPSWRWARPGATLSMVAGAMAVSAVVTTAWHIGRADGGTQDLAAPQVITVPAPQRQQQQQTQRKSATRDAAAPQPPAATTRAGSVPRVRPGVAAVVTSPTPAAVRPKPVTTSKAQPTRSPQPEAKPYGPWNCTQSFAIDFRNRTGLGVKPCQMLGRDIRYQASLTAPGNGARGSITVSLRDAGSGRTVAGPKTCDGLTFDGDAATRSCGPAGAQPTRGRSYTVVVSYRYERDGRTLANTARGSTFEW
ncbi:serine/threonine protein kinase [Paractinoplanes atraurantiacus]|uniref:non-specific serine/threonine protein kinase n=2 Tax=Paractinoplanes atraurantiacus TaxID=1036182 RepID=A0A285K2T9_9ACTN|nr:serine/threonine protein kinase [Actinoplanes atraurantiacus]